MCGLASYRVVVRLYVWIYAREITLKSRPSVRERYPCIGERLAQHAVASPVIGSKILNFIFVSFVILDNHSQRWLRDDKS